MGINEDPVNGATHCALGPYWGGKLGKTMLTACQASTRGGVLRVRLEGERVILGGQAVTVLRGEILSIGSPTPAPPRARGGENRLRAIDFPAGSGKINRVDGGKTTFA